MSDYEVHVSGDETINLSVETDPTQSVFTDTPEEVPMTFNENGTYALLVNDSPEYSISPSSAIVIGGAVTSVNGMTGDVVLAASDIENDVGYLSIVDLGEFDPEDYDWDLWAYFAETTESGFYKAHDIQDGFDYFLRVERTENECYQEYWYTEENSLLRNCRDGKLYDGEWDWSDSTEWVTSEALYGNFYTKGEIDQKLNGKVDTDALGNYYTDVEVDAILENNYYTMDAIDDMFEEFHPVAENMIESTWSNLVTLRNSSQLVKGAYYRITDYNFVTTKLNMQSGNHPFDIVVLAISENMLSETAYACRHQGDHYFEREVTEGGIEWLYTMYVDDFGDSYGNEPMDHQDDLHASDEFCDSDVLTHPNTGDDVPVLYKTDTGEYGIDDPDYDDAYFYEGVYDFDGDEYDMWSKYEFDGDDWVFMQQYALTPIVVEDGELIVSPIPETKIMPVNLNAWELKYCLDNDKDLFDWAETNGKGVIYYMKDEFGNEAPYDFKNAMFKRNQVSSVSVSTLNALLNLYLYQDGYYKLTGNSNSKYWYTFAASDGSGDGSLFGECTYNTIQSYIYLSPKGKNIRGINDIVLQNANRNSLGYNCYNITILSSSDGNQFDGCYAICGTAIAQCIIKNQSNGITLNGASRMSLGVMTRNIDGRYPETCTFGSSCSNISFGEYDSSIIFGSGCSNITFGNWCMSDNINASSGSLTFGNYCSNINIGMRCNTITFTNYYRDCEIEGGVSKITFNTTGGSTSQYVQYVKVCKGVTNKTITPVRKTSYEQIYYATGRQETAL